VTEPRPASAGRRALVLAERSLSAAGRWLGPRRRRLARTWRRSLQLRVTVTTVAVTGLVVLLIGLFLIDQISNGVLRAKRDAAVGQAIGALEPARAHFAGVTQGDLSGIRQAADKLTSDLTSSSNGAGLYGIVVRSPDATIDRTLARGPAVPNGLRRAVQSGVIAEQYAPVTLTDQRTAPGLVVGGPFSTNAGSFELYFLFPLSAEQNTINLVQRTATLAGIGLVLLVALIAWIVTRQVVRPVRLVAQTAQRLAAGDLTQRLTVHGEDDIALLAASFNDMAISLQHQIQRLEQLSLLQQRFTSDVSHELRTPLTTVRMAAELLYTSRGSFAPALARSAELLSNELDRFENLLSDLLEISRYDAGAAHLELDRVDVAGVVERAVVASRSLADRHGAALTLSLPGEPIMAEVDARRVDRILRNLIANALDHAEGKPVDVLVGADDHAVAVAVRDRGVGLRPGEAGLVFNRFWRGDPSRSRLTGGTGLGLAISLEDARLHGGWLQAWGERGRGASFRLTLPRTRGEALTGSPLSLAPTEVDV
jgi:two-component system sensor histidine kinase MtrB